MSTLLETGNEMAIESPYDRLKMHVDSEIMKVLTEETLGYDLLKITPHFFHLKCTYRNRLESACLEDITLCLRKIYFGGDSEDCNFPFI